ncbi:ATP-binding protein [Bradyrhizobium huanghuaihaiense]|uniref:ATP-binding protein n=1 Tax=Bradyrhizobium huanghuaihaiense TaxID=990078 RepID=UPI0021AAEBEC|nr:ATP-binding protein [Bradyrhizobium sp. CB3035]UWU77845.1 ATP-binding protein [Bradyrhizobium sp. CB3035]
MKIARAYIENFRGIKQAEVLFSGTSVLLGDNNTGKSTVFEAIELAIGRSARACAGDRRT